MPSVGGAHYGRYLPHKDDYRTSDASDDDDDNDGEDPNYECLTCGWQTYIANETQPQTWHWCSGDCGTTKRFTKLK